MKYIVLINFGNTIVLVALVILVVKLYKIIRTKQARAIQVVLRILSIILLILFICITYLSGFYNYFYLNGIELLYKDECRESIKMSKKALAMRVRVGKLSSLLERNIVGTPLFSSREEDVRINIAEAYNCLDDYQKAIGQYQIILSNDNNNFDAIAGIAESYLRQHNVEKSKYFYKRLIDVQPKEKHCNYYYQMGQAYVVLKDCENAMKFFSKAVDLGAKEKNINHYMENCYG